MGRHRQIIHFAITALILLFVTTAPPLVANKASERRLAFYNINTKESSEVVYKRYGQWVPGAKKKIDWIMRDWRRDKAKSMDKKLIDTLWEIHTELGSREPIHLISAYRSPKTNAMLRKTRGGQARKSRHMLGLAADVHFPDVPVKRLRYSALVRQRGGVGYYPTSAIPFVHIDTGRVRHWPRMTRTELALLFPNGKTKHRPTDGRPITRRDYAAARRRNQKLAMEVAAFHKFRRSPRAPAPTLVAENRLAPLDKARSPMALAGRDAGQSAWTSQVRRASGDGKKPAARPAARPRYAALTPPAPLAPARPRLRAPAPKLAERPPRIVDRPTPLTKRPSDGDRQALDSLFEYASSFSFSKLFGFENRGDDSDGKGTTAVASAAPEGARVTPERGKHQGRLGQADDNADKDNAADGEPVRVAALGDSGSAFDAIGRLAERFASGPITRSAKDRQDDSGTQAATNGRLAALSQPEQTASGEAPVSDPADLSEEARRKGWVSAPAYDEEHPDELHYRPFSLGPLLTASSSPDDPLLARMVEPDPVATLAMLDDELSALPMRFTPQHEVAAAMWTRQFTGSAVNFGAIPEGLAAAKRPDSSRPLSPRAVRTSAK